MSGKFRGYDIHEVNGAWYFSDTNEKVESTWHKRACGHCNLPNTAEGHDGCLGTLPNIMNACCGHGVISDSYVQFSDGYCVYGEGAIMVQGKLKQQHSDM
ncbi:hypothetical protein [Solibacillus sp. FSL K6-1523]|uniref:hypothetical protein n=1 Tax=Solibacillus sp. FSL K6-1523 TaxID=2921471 RepID=UPI0030F8A86D